MFNQGYGLENLLKDGSRHYQGTEEVILRNIEACVELSGMVKTSFGPNSRRKLI